jgi:AcrR family transcriptional regulator
VARQRSDTRAEIRDTALELFAARGYRATSLREIAERLGITKAALYYHFPSKADLVRELVRPLFDDVEALLAAAERDGVPDRRALLGGYLDVSVRHHRLYTAVLTDVATFADLGLVPAVMAWRTRLTALLVGADPAPADAARAVIAVGGLQDCAVVLADAPIAGYREAALDAAVRALG